MLILDIETALGSLQVKAALSRRLSIYISNLVWMLRLDTKLNPTSRCGSNVLHAQIVIIRYYNNISNIIII